MTIKIASLKVDTKAEAEGEWVDIKEWIGLVPDRPWEVTATPGLRYRVKSMNDSGYKVARQKAYEALEKNKDTYPDGVIPEEITAAADGKAIVDHILLEWDGFDEPYSKELATTLLCDADGRNFRQMVAFCAAKVGKREIQFMDEAAKNSEGQPTAL
jgi:hypothetical protein